MVFGNKGARRAPASRSRATRSPAPRRPRATSWPTPRARTSSPGVRTPRDLAEMADWMPEAHAELLRDPRTLEAHYSDMQDTEFTVEEGALFMLQTRNAKRPAQAAVRFAVDAVEEGLLTRAQAIDTIDAAQPRRAPAPDLRPRRRLRGRSHAASPPRPAPRRAQIVFTAEDAVDVGRARPRGGPRAALHGGRRRARLLRRAGHPHRRGRQGRPRRARRARDGQAVRGRRVRAAHRPRGARAARGDGASCARAT